MRFPRRAGLLLPIPSLPSPFGIGDLGDGAFRFVEFLQRCGVGIWQVLPIGAAAQGNSPYTSYSAFAGNPLLISPQTLVDEGLLPAAALGDTPEFPTDNIDYARVRLLKKQILVQAFQFFRSQATASTRDAFSQFCDENHWWLNDFALFMALMQEFGHENWSEWDSPLAQRQPQALEHWTERLAEKVEQEKFEQFLFFRQWERLKVFANARGIELFGDLPIFVAYESADVWVHQDLFELDEQGRRTVVAGCPPDYFSATGQLWNNPLYRWQAMADNNFQWWVSRLRQAFACFDLVRLDHFRGFEAYWEIPAAAQTAEAGYWTKGPGAELFHAAKRQLGELCIVAEDLGIIGPEVHALRDELEFPGMRVLQFGFDDANGFYHRPEDYPQHCVAYTGTHDNDTAIGWYRGRAHSEFSDGGFNNEQLLQYLGSDGKEFHWDFVRRVFESIADTAVCPLQDVLGLDSSARTNVPGVAEGNWKWRVRQEMLSDDIQQRLTSLVANTHRRAAPPEPPASCDGYSNSNAAAENR